MSPSFQPFAVHSQVPISRREDYVEITKIEKYRTYFFLVKYFTLVYARKTFKLIIKMRNVLFFLILLEKKKTYCDNSTQWRGRNSQTDRARHRHYAELFIIYPRGWDENVKYTIKERRKKKLRQYDLLNLRNRLEAAINSVEIKFPSLRLYERIGTSGNFSISM